MELILIFLLTAVTLITLVTLGKAKIGNYQNPLTVYLFFWGMWLTVSMLDPFELYPVSERAYLLLWTNILFFSLGYLACCKKIAIRSCLELKRIKQNKRLVLYAQCALMLALSYYARKFSLLLGQNAIANVRAIKYEIGLLFSSYTEYAVFNFFIEATVYLSTLFAVCHYVVFKKLDLISIFGIVCVVLFAFIGLGRFIIFDALMFYLLANLFRPRTEVVAEHSPPVRKNRLSKFFYVVFGFVGILGMFLITAARLGQELLGVHDYLLVVGYSFEQLIIYFIGPFRAFDNFLNSRIYEEIGYTLGRASFSGVEEIVYNYVHIVDPKWILANERMANFTMPQILIGNGQGFNAFYTGVMNSYLDGGPVGVMGLAFLYGAVAAATYNYYREHPNVFNYGLFVFLTYSTIASEFKSVFGAPSTWIILFVLTMCGTDSASRFLKGVIPRSTCPKAAVQP